MNNVDNLIFQHFLKMNWLDWVATATAPALVWIGFSWMRVNQPSVLEGLFSAIYGQSHTEELLSVANVIIPILLLTWLVFSVVMLVRVGVFKHKYDSLIEKLDNFPSPLSTRMVVVPFEPTPEQVEKIDDTLLRMITDGSEYDQVWQGDGVGFIDPQKLKELEKSYE